MSNIYIQEPPTNGKVLLVTSVGHIDIELWSKEAPKACRNFVQLCLEGYYDGTIFHRVVKDFIVQGGDPTGTGEGGESIYGQPFKDEFHSRLRFIRRGLVAMANGGPNDNSSQFFFTLAPAPELNNKHTIFGKITGNTVFNMLKLSESEIGADDRPVFPCQINSTEILSNPYNDIIPRENRQAKKDDKADKKSKSKSKATKNFSLLSFGEEAEEDEEEVNKATKDIRVKSKSSHDLADDPQLSSVPVVETEERDSTKRLASDSDEENTKQVKSPGKEAAVKDVRKKLKKEDDNKKTKIETSKAVEGKEEPMQVSRSDELRQEAKKLKKEIKESRKKDDEVKKRDDIKEEKVMEEPVNDAIAAYRKERQKYKDLRKDQKRKGSDREQATMLLLGKFQSKLNSARSLASNYSDDEADKKDIDEEKEDSDDPTDLSWMRHKLEFDEKLHRVLDANITDVDRYEISDPRNPLTQRRRESSKKSSKPRR